MPKVKGLCSLDGCEKPHYAKGLCGMHYRRVRVLGDAGEAAPRNRFYASMEEAFALLVDRDGPVPAFAPHLGRCWVLRKKPGVDGYAALKAAGEVARAHCWSYEQHVGPIPEGLQLDHLCRNRGCVRPSHLEPVTAQTNILRGDAPAAANARRVVCKRGHDLLDPANLKPNSRGARQCRACANIGRRERYARTGQ